MLFRFFSSIFESYTAMKLAWALAFPLPGSSAAAIASAHAQLRGTVLKRFPLVHNLHLVRLQPGRSLDHAIAADRLQPDANEWLCLDRQHQPCGERHAVSSGRSDFSARSCREE